MPDNKPSHLPNYGNPPVVETVLGVQFDRLSRVTNAHLGAFWNSLDASEWPTVEDASLLPRQLEQFEMNSAWARAAQIQLKVTQDPACRLRIKSADDDRMIQVQNTRLHFNWLRTQEGKYPRYEKIQKGFASTLDRFMQFIAERGLGEFCPNQWEVTYVNQIPQGTVWTTPADWGFFRPLAGVPTVEGVIEGESFGGEWHFTIPPQRGRLHIQWQHGKAAHDGNENEAEDFIRLILTARGPIPENGNGEPSILAGLSLGRETIVRSFKSLMSEDANHFWGLKK